MLPASGTKEAKGKDKSLMQIQIEKTQSGYRADCLNLPGSPPVGIGLTEAMAVAQLAYVLLFSDTGGENPTRWADCIDKDEPVTIHHKHSVKTRSAKRRC
jgi:hypothetical protein